MNKTNISAEPVLPLLVDELFFESFSFNALVDSVRVWVTKSSHNTSVRVCGFFEPLVKHLWMPVTLPGTK